MGHINKAKAFELSAGNVSVFGEFSEKLKNNKKAVALGTTPLALILSACGGGSSSTTSSNVLTLTKSADTYSASAVTGFTVADSSTAKFDVADASSNAYEIKLDATGTGVIEFDFADANDTVTLAAGSKTSGFTTLKVTDGTLDATNADLTGITRVEVASGIKISLAQIKEIPTIVANSATSEITVEVTSEAEATELVSLIAAGTVAVYGDVNPIKLVAAPSATVTAETLTAKQTETTSSVKTTAEAPADTSATDTTTTTTTGGGGGGGGTVSKNFSSVMSGNTLSFDGNATGDISVVANTTSKVVDATRDGVKSLSQPFYADVTGMSVASGQKVVMTAADYATIGATITGAGDVSITASDGAQTIGLANSGTNTIDVGSGADTVNVSTGTNTVTTGTGADTVNLTSTSGTQKVKVASENGVTNIIKATGTGATYEVTIEGTTAGTILNASTSTKNVKITGTSVADTIIGGSGADTIIAGDGNDIITGNAGNDTLTGGAGNDTYKFSATSQIGTTNIVEAASGGTDRIEGSAAIDYTGLTVGGSADLSGASAAGIEEIQLKEGVETIFTGSQLTGNTIKFNEGGDGTTTLTVNVAAASTVDLSNLAFSAWTSGNAFDDAADVLKIASASGATSENITGSSVKDTITADDGADIIDGKAGADDIDGGAGNDLITGGAGADVLKGGAGDDAFIVASATDAGSSETYNGGTTGETSGDRIVVTGTTAIDFSDDTLTSIEELNLALAADNSTSATDTQSVTLSDAQVDGLSKITSSGSDSITLSDAMTSNMLDDTVVSGAVTFKMGNFNNALTLTNAVLTDASHTLTVDGTAMTSDKTLTVDTTTEATGIVTIIGSAATDNVSTTLAKIAIVDGKTGTDTLTLTGSAAGALVIDTGSTTDQVVSINGNAESSVQKGFERFDTSGVTTSGTTITMGAASHHFTGANAITDTVNITNLALTGTLNAGTGGTDVLKMDGATLGSGKIVGFETIEVAGASNLTAVLNSSDAAGGATGAATLKFTDNGTATLTYAQVTGLTTITEGTANSVIDVDLAAATSGTVSADFSTTNIALSGLETDGTDKFDIDVEAVSGGTGYTIIGTAISDEITVIDGVNTITGGANADSITLGSGVDTVVINAEAEGGSAASDSSRVTISGNANDTGEDTLTGVSSTDVIKVVLTNVNDFEHGDDTDLGSADGADDGAAGSFLATVGLISTNGDTSFNDAGDIALTFASYGANSGTLTEVLFEGHLQYDMTSDTDGSTMTGGSKSDTITGGAGVDVITGGGGNDVIALGSGDNVADKVTFAADSGTDAVSHFEVGASGDILVARITLNGGTAADTILEAAALTDGDTASEISNNAVIAVLADDSSRAALEAALNAEDFDTTVMDRIFLLDVGSKVEVILASNTDTDDDGDVSLTVLATLEGIADIASGTFHTDNIDFVA